MVRFELTTFGLTVQCSNHLSYKTYSSTETRTRVTGFKDPCTNPCTMELGAFCGNRTHVITLEESHSTTELRMQMKSVTNVQRV